MAALPVAAILAVFASGIYFSHSAHAASYVNVSSGGSGDTAGVVSLGKIKPSSSGSTATGNDTLTVHTDCSAGYKVYVSGQNGKTTNLTNQSAEDPTNPSTADIISASSNTIASPNTLSSNTWGISGSSTDIENHLYAGLPAYADSTNVALVIKTNVEEESTVPIYYGVKANTTLNPGTYSGDVLYTVLMDTSCVPYVVEFDPNVENPEGVTGKMPNQSILPNTPTKLTANAYERSGYVFLGWDEDAEATEPAYTDEEEVTNLTTSGSAITLYAIWGQVDGTMQNWLGCGKMSTGQIASLQDTRDNKIYHVKKLPDGNCWMIDNLTISATGMVVDALDNTNTNIPDSDNNKYYLPPQDRSYQTVDSITNPAVKTANAYVNFNDNGAYTLTYSRYPQVGYRTKNTTNNDTGNPVPEDTAYYNFYTATLGYSYYQDSRKTGSSPRDICPKGWRLPWTSDSGSTRQGNAEFYKLALTYNSNSSVWNNYIAPTGTSSSSPYTSDSTVRQNMVSDDSDSLDRFANNSAIGFTHAGFYKNTILAGVGTSGRFWSSSVYGTNSSYGLSIGYYDKRTEPQHYNDKHLGYAVRCIAQYSDVSGAMQDFNQTTISANESIKLLDKRDNSIYTIKKFSDGSVWMVNNLILGHDKGYALTNELTNIPDSDTNTYYLPRAGYSGALNNSSTTGSAVFDSSTRLNQAHVQYRAQGQGGDQSSSGTLSQSTGYYNFYAATLGFSYYKDDKSSSISAKDICPKGWKLPNGDTGSKSWYYFYNTLNSGSHSNMVNDASFLYSGLYDSSKLHVVGSFGYWWSSTVDSTDRSYALYLGSSSGVYPQDNRDKYNGLAVRCVAQSSATINFDANGGIGEMEQQIIRDNDNNLRANTFTKDGYNFVGWSEDSSATTATYADGASASDLASRGGTIMLYAVWEKAQYMQEFACSSLSASGETKTLIDKRDGQAYTVYRIPTSNAASNVAGKCIMTKDLNLGAVNSVEGAASTITAQGTMNLSPEDSNFTTPSGSGESIIVPTTTTSITHGTPGSGDNVYANRQYRADGTGDYAGRGYYTWGAAMMACPKGWRLPTQDELNNDSSNYNASTTGISKAVNNDVSIAQSSPWSFVFGGYYYNEFGGGGSYGHYWSSTQYDSTYSYYLNMASYGSIRHHNGKFNGYAVRCIADIPTEMQAFMSCYSLPTGRTSVMVDSRDNQAYTVYRFPTSGTAGVDYPSGLAGYCMMTKDLGLGYQTGGSTTKGGDLTLTTSDSAAAATITARTGTSDWSTTDSDSNKQYINGAGGANDSHSYYSYGAAQAVCPNRWGLPSSAQYNSIASFMGGNSSTGSSRIRSTPYNFAYNGYFDSSSWRDVGSNGSYWASTQYSSTDGYYLLLNSSSLGTYGSHRYYGQSVRCIAYPSGCFTAGTQVQITMEGDTKSIEDIKVGEQVVSYDPSNHEYYLTEVVDTIVHDKEEKITKLAKLTLDDGTTLEMTLNHPILTTDGYKAVQNGEYGTLTENDTIITTDGEHGISTLEIYDTEPTVVYNLTVKGRDGDAANGLTHSYIANGVVVHNVTSGSGA